MFKFLFWSILFVFAGFFTVPLFISHPSPQLVLNMWNEQTLPRHFRKASDPFIETSNPLPSRLGLDNLKISGSAQYSINGLKTILNSLPSSKMTVLDLRQESHGFMNGMAVSWDGDRDWANKNKTLAQIQEDEWNRLQKTLDQKLAFIAVYKKYPFPFYIRNVDTEEDVVNSLGPGYFRIPVTDHLKPSDAAVDEFIRFVKGLPKDTWIHFHCAAGEGRTTTFMAMYDMMQNASQVNFEDIIKRQWLIGGLNLTAIKKNDWKLPYEVERLQFLAKFYQYCKENPLFFMPWSSWAASK